MPEAKSPSIINVAAKAWYPKAQARLIRSLDAVEYLGARIFWTECYPPGSPTHDDNPYAFKPWAFWHARDSFHDHVLWVDASCWAIRHPKPLFDIIARDGYLLFDCGFNVGDWCCDPALALLQHGSPGLSRETLRGVQMVACTIMGLDVTHPTARTFLDRWMAHARVGVFRGPWRNVNGEASSEPKVQGHRHDQVSAGLIAHEMGLKLTSPHGLYAYEAYGNWPEETVLLTRGM